MSPNKCLNFDFFTNLFKLISCFFIIIIHFVHRATFCCTKKNKKAAFIFNKTCMTKKGNEHDISF